MSLDNTIGSVDDKLVRHAAFFLPVIGNEIHLGQRNSAPYEGLWCATGGKQNSNAVPQQKFRTHQFVSQDDMRLLTQAASRRDVLRESPMQMAIREYCEEVHADKKYPNDFSEDDFTNVYTIGYVEDAFHGIHFRNHIVIGEVHRTDFDLSTRELRDFKPLSKINPESIVPITRTALRHIYERQRYRPDLNKRETEEEIGIQLSSPLRTTYHRVDVGVARNFTQERNLVIPWREIDTGPEFHYASRDPPELSENDQLWRALSLMYN